MSNSRDPYTCQLMLYSCRHNIIYNNNLKILKINFLRVLAYQEKRKNCVELFAYELEKVAGCSNCGRIVTADDYLHRVDIILSIIVRTFRK